MKKSLDQEGWETNRYKKLKSNKSKFWCRCDKEGCGKGEKCSYIKRSRNRYSRLGGGKRKLKKY